MNQYVDLLDLVKKHLSGEEKIVELQSIFNPEGSIIGKSSGDFNYEVISYLIVS